MGNRWDERYGTGEMADKPPEPVLVRSVAALPPGEALDLACGIGRHALWLARQGWKVTAVDYSAVALQLLREEAADLPVCVVQADIEAGELRIEPESYDLICDCCFLYRPLFESIRAGVRPGGMFVGVFPLEGVNPAFLAQPGEALSWFEGWDILHYTEDRRAEIVVRKNPIVPV